MRTVVPVILAGGSGTRLWPLSREDRPKQFLRLASDESLLQRTIRRALRMAGPDRILTVGDERHHALLNDDLSAIDPTLVDGILLEPVGRNTAAALSLAALIARERWPDAMLWVMPADHAVEDERALCEAVDQAMAAADAGWIVTFGIEPERPETAFGYIKQGSPLPDHEGVYAVSAFIEKPPLDGAERMVRAQCYLWNSGMLITGADTFLDALAVHAPAIRQAVEDAVREQASGRSGRIDRALYGRVPAEPFDKAVLERSDRVAVVPCDLGWSDVGTWNNLWELMPHDANGNVVDGAVVLDRTSDSLVHATNRLVACSGVHGIAVIETADAILIADRSDASGVKHLIQRLQEQNRPEIATTADQRDSWGHYRVLHRDPDVTIRELVVQPGSKISLDLDTPEREHWVVAKGAARITYGDRTREVTEGGCIEIAPRLRYRIETSGTELLRLIEVRHRGDGTEATVRIEEVGDRIRAAS